MIENTTDRSNGTTNDLSGRVDFGSLWAETLVETLYDAIENNWSSNALRVIIKQLQNKGYSRKIILGLVEEKFGKAGCEKIIKLSIN